MEYNDFLKTKLSDVDKKTLVKGFLTTAKMGLCEKEEVEEYYQKVSKEISNSNIKVFELRNEVETWDKSSDAEIKKLVSKFNTKNELLNALNNAEQEKNEWIKLGDELDLLRYKNKNFNK